MRKIKGLLAAALSGCALLALPSPGEAQDYPNRPIEWVVPSSAGSGFDVTARIITTKLGEVLGQSVIVQNIAGAGGTVGSAKAAEADADGYTVLMTNVNHTANEALRPNKSYVLLEDFEPVLRFAVAHYVIVVRPSLGVNSLEELIALAKDKPGELNWGSAGVGSSTFMLGSMFNSAAGIEATHIPYEGGGPALAGAVAGEVDYYGSPYTTGKPFIDEGTLKALAVTAAEPVDFLPDLPAAAEAVPGFAFTSWYGIMMPRGVPIEARDKFKAALIETIEDPTVKKGLTDLGLEIIEEGPEDFGAYLEKEIAVMNKAVDDAGIERR